MVKILVSGDNAKTLAFLMKAVETAGWAPVLAHSQDEIFSLLSFANPVGALLGYTSGAPVEVASLASRIKESMGVKFPVVVVGGEDLVPGQVAYRGAADVALKGLKPQVLVYELKQHFANVIQLQEKKYAAVMRGEDPEEVGGGGLE